MWSAMMSIPEWLGGLVAGVVLAIVVKWIDHFLGVRSERRHRLILIYSKLVGVVSDDIERARQVDGALKRGAPATRSDHEAFGRWVGELARLDEPRHKHRKDLARLAAQIRILERDAGMTKLLQELVKSQAWFFYHPFVSGPEAWQTESCREQQVEYTNEVRAYSERLEQFIEAACAEYGKGQGWLRSLARRLQDSAAAD